MFFSMLFAWFISQAGAMADSVIAGIFIGEEAVSGIELVSPVWSILAAGCYLAAVGTPIVYSRFMGAGKKEEADKAFGQGAIVSASIGVISIILCFVIRDPYFAFYGSSPEIEAYGKAYFNSLMFYALVNPFIYYVYDMVVADGDETAPFLYEIISAVSNIVLSIVLIGPLGTFGLGLATTISYIMGFLTLIPHFRKKENTLHFAPHFKLSEMKELLTLSSTVILTGLYVAVVDIVMNKFIIFKFGSQYLAAYTIINFALNMTSIFCVATSAAAPFINVAFGERNPLGVKRAMKKAVTYGLGLSVAFIILFETTAGLLPGVFGITSPDVSAAATLSSQLIAVFFPVSAIVYVFLTYYPEIDHPLLGNLLSIGYMLVSPLLFPIPLALPFGFTGFIIGFALSPIMSIVLWYAYAKIKKIEKKLPFLLDDTDESVQTFDLILNNTEIVGTRNDVAAFMEKFSVPESISNKVQLMLEETLVLIRDRNSGKRVLAEVSVMVGPDHVRLITKDNGVIFDITDSNSEIKSLNCYVVACLQEKTESSNITTISFNRNSYLWNYSREEA